jgi:hypothetical protein
MSEFEECFRSKQARHQLSHHPTSFVKLRKTFANSFEKLMSVKILKQFCKIERK